MQQIISFSKINEFLNHFPDEFSYLPIRILNNCILLPIEAESQDTALRIFSTLNDRGKPLSDSDIFKAQFYKYYSGIGKKDYFIQQWKELEEICNDIFHPIQGTPMDEIFTRYMYYERARQGLKSSTTEALRKFYERDSYKLLKSRITLDNIIDLANFWKDITNQDDERFSNAILRRLFVLNYAPNGMWTYIVSVYYMSNKDKEGNLDEGKFLDFLNKIIGFIWSYAVTNPGVNALRTPIYAEMINIVNGQPIEFNEFKFEANYVRNVMNNYMFGNNRAITKSMLTWWAYEDDRQGLLSLETVLEIEHIYARNRYDKEKSLNNNKNLEALGNKVLLEKKINIRASDYRFEDKVKYYKGYENRRKQKKEGTKIIELLDFANTKTDFVEEDIEKRNSDILEGFIQFLQKQSLLKY
jgi:hypothetical protein